MKRIDTWVTRNLDPTEQGIIARDGLDVCAVTWNLINNSKLVCKTYADHAAHIWMMLDAKAEQYSSRPLQILDDYGMKRHAHADDGVDASDQPAEAVEPPLDLG